ncbi:ribonuclease H-like domain-containing protein [Tanacetum coccineum]
MCLLNFDAYGFSVEGLQDAGFFRCDSTGDLLTLSLNKPSFTTTLLAFIEPPPRGTDAFDTRVKISESNVGSVFDIISLLIGTSPISSEKLDVKNAFLHGQLSETVYMHQPPGFVDSAHPNYVCHLQRSLYGLKQAPRAWFQRFASFITRVGFQHSKTDTSLFVYHMGSDVAYLLLYVDDIILTASSTALLQRIITLLHSEFAMTDLGSLNYFLGVSAQRSKSGLFLSQSKFAEEILERAHMQHCNPCKTPVDTESKLGSDGDPVSDIHFVREYVASGQVRVLHVPSRFQYADIFTKGLPTALFLEFRSSLNVRRSPAHTEGEY